VALDVETTGLSPEKDRIIEIGAIRFLENGDEISRFQSLINPRMIIPYRVTEIHGIRNEDVAGERLFGEVFREFAAWMGQCEEPFCLAHNARFDTAFLGSEIERNNLECDPWSVACTLELVRRKQVPVKSKSLTSLANHFNLERIDGHRALADCFRVKGVWLRICGPDEPWDELRRYPIGKA